MLHGAFSPGKTHAPLKSPALIHSQRVSGQLASSKYRPHGVDALMALQKKASASNSHWLASQDTLSKKRSQLGGTPVW